MNAPGNPAIRSLRLPVDEDPAGWVWLNQQPLIIPRLDSETAWPAFVSRARREFGISTVVLVPLTAGESRLGRVRIQLRCATRSWSGRDWTSLSVLPANLPSP